jgi:hypothetical protein
MQMNDVHIDIRLEGEHFSPSKFMQLSQIHLEIIAEAGVIAKRGRYRGMPSPYGMALWPVVHPDNRNPNANSLFQSLTELLTHKDDFGKVGIEDITIDIDTPKYFSLDPETLALIAQLKATLDFNVNTDNRLYAAEGTS